MNIKSALDEVEKIANYINERKKEHDSLEMVQKIQDRFSPKDAPLLKESRRFISEIVLYIVDPEFQPPKNGIIKKKKGREPTPDQLGLLKVFCSIFQLTLKIALFRSNSFCLMTLVYGARKTSSIWCKEIAPNCWIWCPLKPRRTTPYRSMKLPRTVSNTNININIINEDLVIALR